MRRSECTTRPIFDDRTTGEFDRLPGKLEGDFRPQADVGIVESDARSIWLSSSVDHHHKAIQQRLETKLKEFIEAKLVTGIKITY